MRIDSNGNVGIGTESPTAKLELVENLSSNREILYPLVLRAADPTNYDQTTDDGIGIQFMLADQGGVPNSPSFIGASIAAKRGDLADDSSVTDLVFSVSQNDETLDEAMRIDSSGQVGIGTVPSV